MSVTKPIVFFSHSSRDSEPLQRLKKRFVELTSGMVEVFLSSDGQSIRFGKNWVSSIEDALKQADVMFVFLTPQSVNSSWIYFESGHAYSKGIDVVPVGLFGVDVGKIPPPLSLLQGFNVTSPETLNNIIVKVNELVQGSFPTAFKSEDFQALETSRPDQESTVLGHHVNAMLRIDLSMTLPDAEAKKAAKDLIKAIDLPRTDDGNESYSLPGAHIEFSVFDQKIRLQVSIDPELAQVVLPPIEGVCRAVVPSSGSEPLPYRMEIFLSRKVRYLDAAHLVMGRMYRTGTVPHDGQFDLKGWEPLRTWFRSGDLVFSVGCSTFAVSINELETSPILALHCFGKSYVEAGLGALLNQLFKSKVFWYRGDVPYED